MLNVEVVEVVVVEVVEAVVEVVVVDGDGDLLVGLVVDAVEDGDVPAPLVEQRDD